MRRIVLSSFAVLAVAHLAHAGTILYATAATTNGVDGFCLGENGALGGTPSTHVDTIDEPRRLIVGDNGVLYVVARDGIQAFEIKDNGALKRDAISSTILQKPSRMNAQDAALNLNERVLYVPQNGYDRIVAYPLNADGTLPGGQGFTSCVLGPSSSGFQRLLLDGTETLLYVTAHSLGGHIAVYQLGADGKLPLQPADCAKASSSACPLYPDTDAYPADKRKTPLAVSVRRKLGRPRSIVRLETPTRNHLYVESLLYHRLFAFEPGADGLFAPPVHKKTGEVVNVCLTDTNGESVTGPFRWQMPSTKTNAVNAYQDVVLGEQVPALYGSEFLRGRVDAFPLDADGELPRVTKGTTKEDVRGSPVGLLVRGSILYVAAGELDRVQAFHLGPKGLPSERTPFSQTDEQKNSFPNALAIAETQQPCR